MAACEQPKALMIFLNNRELLEDLSDAERGRLLLALFDYQERGTLPTFDGDLRIVFKILRRDVDQSVARWEAECAKRSAAGKKSAAIRAAKKFADQVSCNNDFSGIFPTEEAPTDPEGSEVLLNGAEQQEALFKQTEQPEAPLNTVEQTSAMSTHTNKHSQSHSQTHPQTQTQSQSQPQFCSLCESRVQTASDPQPEPCSPASRASSDFDRFWQAYPRKVGKQAAQKAFGRAGVPIERLLSALERQRADPQWQRENGRFIPHPVTWLNQGRWEDEPPAPPQDCGLYGVESL